MVGSVRVLCGFDCSGVWIGPPLRARAKATNSKKLRQKKELCAMLKRKAEGEPSTATKQPKMDANAAIDEDLHSR